MGCDIHSYVEVRRDGSWRRAVDATEPFDWQDYGLFGFLADVRNHSHSPVIAEPRGLPDDADLLPFEREEALWCDYHSHSWLTLAELLAYDYDQVFWDRRVTKQRPNGVWDGAALADEGEGAHPTLREFLGEHYFRRLDDLSKLGDPQDVRVVFWFDN